MATVGEVSPPPQGQLEDPTQQTAWPGQEQAVCVEGTQCPIVYAFDPSTEQFEPNTEATPITTEQVEAEKCPVLPLIDSADIPSEWRSVYTVMMRNLPNRFSQLMLLLELSSAAFHETFDFLYLPIDPNTWLNKGYAFINFSDPAHAWCFKQCYDGKQMGQKSVLVSPADLQGFEANYSHYFRLRCSRGHPACRPLFLPSRNANPLLTEQLHNHREQPGVTISGGLQQKQEANAVAKFCPYCGVHTQRSYRFCNGCGASLLEDDEGEEEQ